MIREEMTRNGFSDRPVRKYLLAESKMISKIRQQIATFAAENSTNLNLDQIIKLNHDDLTELHIPELIKIIEITIYVS